MSNDVMNTENKMIKNNPLLWETFEEYHAEQMKDDEFRIYYEKERFLSNIARKVHELRKDAKLTQKALAEKVETTQPVIARLESNINFRMPSLDLLNRIATALNMRLSLNFESVS